MAVSEQAWGNVPVDPTTSLYRFGSGGPSLVAALASARATQRRLALLHIDIDRLHVVNADQGESMGDLVLAAVAQRLDNTMPRNAWLWRLNSDEFIVAVAYLPDEPDGSALAERLRDAVETPLWIPPHTIQVTLSIGIAVFPDSAPDAAALLDNAERALRAAKRTGPGKVGLYAVTTSTGRTDDEFSARFLQALEDNELELHYQPLVDAQNGGLLGFGTLLRWNSPEYGLLRPSHFLDTVARTGMTPALATWVAEATVRQLADWRRLGIDYLSLSLHIVDTLLAQPDCVERLDTLLRLHGVDAGTLELEVSEHALARDARGVRETITGLRALGVSLTLQDFGLSGASFGALTRYPLDGLKIGRAFIHDVASNPRSAAIVRGIVTIGHRLGMKVTAKGVESEAELGFLRRNHCDYFMGNLFGPPLPASELEGVISRRFLLPDAFSAPDPNRCLLLLDDEENMLRALVRLFRRDGYRVLTANSVGEAFDLLASNPVQVIVSDQRMPDMSGTEFLAKVSELHPDTVRMVLSGYTDLATITEAINRGAIYRFLTKPWDDDELRGHIRAAFRTHERRTAGGNAY